ncbi:hypothetical protein BKA70DRAFT_1445092 [Coprinopsis sp. MPI-PUGE-AT-0042]|nr:hypothetical protein BKA70DRAFT_1445092 [Coprinopsis sp. MPI-PUGE-AT-0042]
MRSFRFYPVAIPDEIIKEILSPVLEIPDKAFVHPSLHSGPFASYKLTSSTVLEVCKAWLRVATPLLYETVVLRSKAQAQALARALQGNPDLGRFVKKARIEGGYGDDILEIFKRCPALKDLWISAALWSNESVAGYAKAFHYINPQKLIVFDNPMQEKDSKIKKAVYSRLGEAALSDWTDLSVVIMDIHTALLNRAAPLISGILRGKSKIELLGLIGSRAKASGMVLDLLTMPTLKEIRRLSWWTKKPAFEDIAITRRNALEYCMRQDRLFYEKVLYVQDLSEGTSQPAFETAPVASTVNPNWRPLSLCGASEAERSKILTLIIHNAMSPLELGTAEILTSTGNTTLQLFRAGLMQVSREFRDLAKAGLYEAPVIKPRGIRTLAASPFVGLVRYLWLLDESRIASEDLVHLITCANNLVLISFVGTPHREAFSHGPPNVAPYIWSNFRHHFCIPTTSIVKLSLHSAGTLQHLHLGVESSRKRITKGEVSTFMEAFSQLHQLRSLVLTSGPSARPPPQQPEPDSN